MRRLYSRRARTPPRSGARTGGRIPRPQERPVQRAGVQLAAPGRLPSHEGDLVEVGKPAEVLRVTSKGDAIGAGIAPDPKRANSFLTLPEGADPQGRVDKPSG